MKPFLLIVTLIAGTLGILCLALYHGSVALSAHTIDQAVYYLWLQWLANSHSVAHSLPAMDPNTVLIVQLRLARLVNAFVTGGLLSLAGVLMQVLLQNPLADPYILGTSGGASSFVLLGILSGVGWQALPAWAFAGAALSSLLVLSLAHWQRSWSSTHVLLTGVMVASAWGAFISFLLSVSTHAELPSMLFWLLGNVRTQAMSGWGLGLLVLGLGYGLVLSRRLNLLCQGETTATLLGLSVRGLQVQLFVLSSLFTAIAVTLAGNIGFVGLMIPHLVRLGLGPDHRRLLPGSVLAGGSLLVLADLGARTCLAPEVIPVGVLTALLGIPMFLLLMIRQTHTTI